MPTWAWVLIGVGGTLGTLGLLWVAFWVWVLLDWRRGGWG